LDEPETRPDRAPAPDRPASDRLDSWKKIAVYLKRDVTTVQRWERREGMPVHRHLHDKQGSVFAYRSELDDWSESRRMRFAEESLAPQPAVADDTAGAPSARQPAPAGVVSSGESTGPLPALADDSAGASTARRPAPADDSPSGVVLSPSGASPGRSWLLRRGALALALALLLLAGIIAWFVLDETFSGNNPLAGAKFSRLSDFDGTEQAAAISPSGKYLSVLARRGAQIDVWVSEIGSGAYRNLTKGALPELVNPSIRTLGFSADSSLVYIWARKGDGTCRTR